MSACRRRAESPAEFLRFCPASLASVSFPPDWTRGNSVRGVKFCREISAEFYLHMFNAPQISTTVLRRRTFLGEVFSNRLRSEDDRKILERFGKGIEVLLIQGAVVFGRVEVLIREIMAHERICTA